MDSFQYGRLFFIPKALFFSFLCSNLKSQKCNRRDKKNLCTLDSPFEKEPLRYSPRISGQLELALESRLEMLGWREKIIVIRRQNICLDVFPSSFLLYRFFEGLQERKSLPPGRYAILARENLHTSQIPASLKTNQHQRSSYSFEQKKIKTPGPESLPPFFPFTSDQGHEVRI